MTPHIYNIHHVYLCKVFLKNMRKNIDIEDKLLRKLRVISAFEEVSVKVLMEKAVSFFVAYKEKERLNSLTEEEKEDLGLLLLMHQSERDETVSKDEIIKVLK